MRKVAPTEMKLPSFTISGSTLTLKLSSHVRENESLGPSFRSKAVPEAMRQNSSSTFPFSLGSCSNNWKWASSDETKCCGVHCQ